MTQQEFLSEDHFLLTDFVGQRFYQVEINTGKIWGTFRPNAFSTALAVDPENKKVFWSDYLRKEIRSSYLNGSQATTLITTGPEHAGRLAVDSVTGNIFYSAFNRAKGNHTRSYIAVVSADGQSRRMIVFGLNSPRAVALHPGQGVIFWSDYGPRPVIERANMDGSQRVPIISTDITQPNGIAIDLKTNQLFWVDGVRHTIERCSFHGMDRQKLLHDPFAQPMQIVLYGDKLYYTGWNKRGIIVMDKADGGNRRYLMESAIFAELSDFVVVWSNMQEKVTNMCSENNGGCSSFCLPTPSGRTCACTDRVLLQTDDRTCIGDLLPALSASSPEPKTDSSDKTGKIVIIAASISAGVVVVVVSIVLVVAIVTLRRWRASLPEVAVGYSPHTSRSTVTSSSANPSTTDDIRTNIPSVSVSSPMSVLNRSPCRTQPANQRADLSYLTPCFSNEYASPDEYYNDDDAKLD
ncbi:low-density lipoprotein receptor-related protein 5-like [Liolophura sinensis]|uniref:low-density lipoprotein receptor-related protein 5-like n=1 Tax=Liolophura sinensis TaxID=3198878 RepID=UPI0031590B66